MKTNKSLTKRLKITRTGKVLRRGAGQDHFNAKEKRSTQLNGKRHTLFQIRRKTLARFVPVK